MSKPLDKMTKAELRQIIRSQNDELQALRARVSVANAPSIRRSLRHEEVLRFFKHNPEQKSATAPVIAAWCAANPPVAA